MDGLHPAFSQVWREADLGSKAGDYVPADDNHVERLSWDRVAARIASGACAILPIGAGAKEHGFHLPMNTDRIQAEALSSKIAENVDALIWPTVTYGYYPAFTEYSGSCSLTVSTFEALIEELVGALAGYGCKAVFVLDTGISTIAPIERALRRLANNDVVHLKIHQGHRYKCAAEQFTSQKYGSHADELETSLMLALAPNAVDMARAEASPSIGRNACGPLTSRDPTLSNYSRSGVFGDPTLATFATGKVLLSAMIDDTVEQVKNFLEKEPISIHHSEDTR